MMMMEMGPKMPRRMMIGGAREMIGEEIVGRICKDGQQDQVKEDKERDEI